MKLRSLQSVSLPAASLAAIVFLASCKILQPLPDPSHRYLLEPVSSVARAASGPHAAVAVARVNLPGYLDRGALVLRMEDGTLQPSAVALWGEPLDAAIARVTAANLRALTGNPAILPADDFLALDYSRVLEITIHRFEQDASRQMALEAGWTLAGVRDKEKPRMKSFRTSVALPVVEPGARVPSGDVVAAMNECLARLASAVAGEIRGGGKPDG